MKNVKYSGMGRIRHINMYIMSLYESRDLMDMFNSVQESMKTSKRVEKFSKRDYTDSSLAFACFKVL